ncbi:hypothetical protein [Enterovirga rhinocerotis]|uniref:Uncharacterized protein n=1 Tax=Enterovirga rhinocerotis TaxID=1339210 RepID=A0A4R7BVL9_9HYPH|nr:hypothetical protein [Enterovirga rhinocerotis]TDR89122.1 hypothetical protein EV668_3610 [Enterovirga rhinocerotis]
MPSLAEVHQAQMRRAIEKTGEVLTLRRVVPNAPPIEKQVRGRVMGYAPDELAAGISIGERKVILPADEVEASGFPTPLRKGTDRIVVRGTHLTIVEVDDSTRRIGGELVAYEIRASGA